MAQSPASTIDQPASTPGPVTIKLSDVATTYIDALQRLFDYTAFFLGSSRLINEEQYDEFSRGMGVMPSNRSRMGYDIAKEATERWHLKHLLTEGLGIVVLAMADCRTLCALSEWKKNGGENQAELQKIVTEQRRAFEQLSLEEKLDFLKSRFGLDLGLRDHLMALAKLRNVLASPNSVVGKEDCESGGLRLRLKMVQLVTGPGDTASNSVNVSTQVTDADRVLPEGMPVRLNKQEYVGCVITLAFFITGLMQGVQEFGKRAGMASAN